MSSDKKQIYIVDDDESVRRALGMLLGTFELKVTTFPSAEEFFASVSNNAPGCLIMDIHMEGINGWDAQKKLVDMGCKRPVIIISADKNSTLKERASKAGVVGFLQKPFNDQDLVDLIQEAFKKGNEYEK